MATNLLWIVMTQLCVYLSVWKQTTTDQKYHIN